MVGKPILCPHGILGKSKCKECKNEYARESHRKKRLALGFIVKPRPKCSHGKFKTRCFECRIERRREKYLKGQNLKRRLINLQKRDIRKLGQPRHGKHWRKKVLEKVTIEI